MSDRIDRFLGPQETDYPAALEELRAGRKTGHWMWYIFPQLQGLGQSTMAWHYGIEDLAEARDYLAHPVLGRRLREISALLLEIPQADAIRIFGWTDSLKLRSCMTLFAQAGGEELFYKVLDKFYQGQPDEKTLAMLKQKA